MDNTKMIGVANRDIGKGEVVTFECLVNKQAIFNINYVENILKEKDTFERINNEFIRKIKELDEIIDNNMLLIKLLREKAGE